jgi:membrane-bound lytic murein transglycosylase D
LFNRSCLQKEKQLKTLLTYGFALMLFFLAAVHISGDTVTRNETLPQKIHGVFLKQEVNLAGEKVPLEILDIRERFEKELILNAYKHGSTLMALKNAKRYFPYIERKLREMNMPDDLKYIVAAESDFQNLTSAAGARGFWQIMPTVGKMYQLEQTEYVDERFHFEKSTAAALQLLQKYFDRFGTWTDAVAAYNLGETAYAKEKSLQKQNSFYDLNIASETMRYVFRILAFKSILSNPEQYGYYLEPEDYYSERKDTQSITIDYSIESLADFAAQQGITYRTLKIYNPWLLSDQLPNPSKKEYTIVFPLGAR